MTVEIDDSFIRWLREVAFSSEDVTAEEITRYVNDVLASHRRSWEVSGEETQAD